MSISLLGFKVYHLSNTKENGEHAWIDYRCATSDIEITIFLPGILKNPLLSIDVAANNEDFSNDLTYADALIKIQEYMK